MNTWQTAYEQLQEILNKCIELWWRVNNIDIYKECKIFNDYAIYYIENNWYNKSGLYSYHHLFSKDSGLMEFVEWKEPDNQVHMILWWLEKYNYMMMWPMTAEEKIRYFLDNVIIPTK